MSKKTTYGPEVEVSKRVTEQEYHRYGKKGVERRVSYDQKTDEGRAGSIKMFKDMAAAPRGRERIKKVYEGTKKWMREKGLPDSFKNLVTLKFGALDDEYLTREIIRHSEIILQENVKIDEAVEATLQFSLLLENFNDLQGMIHDVKKPRKSNSLRPDIKAALLEIGPNHYMVVLSCLEEKKIVQGKGDKVQWQGNPITIKRFENMVLEEINALKLGNSPV